MVERWVSRWFSIVSTNTVLSVDWWFSRGLRVVLTNCIGTALSTKWWNSRGLSFVVSGSIVFLGTTTSDNGSVNSEFEGESLRTADVKYSVYLALLLGTGGLCYIPEVSHAPLSAACCHVKMK